MRSDSRSAFSKSFFTILIYTLLFTGCKTQITEPRPEDIYPPPPGIEYPQPDFEPMTTEQPQGKSNGTPTSEETLGKVLQSEIQRDLTPDVAPKALDDLVSGNRQFALDFYQSIRNETGNIFYSPYSISLALAMTYGGARGDTEAQMSQVLGFSLPQASLHPAFNTLDLELASRESATTDVDNQPFQLNIANSIWGQYDFEFLSEYLDLLASNYGAGLRLVDFVNAAEPARKEINEWVSKGTNAKIKDLIPEGAINDLTRLVLANAIYFKADWMAPFENSRTQEMPFNLLDDSTVSAEMMSYSSPAFIPYTEGQGYQAVEIPYVGETVSMILLVPEKGNFDEIESNLTAEQLDTILNSLQPLSVDLSMPKFSFESEFNLKSTLMDMGIQDAFTPDVADFSGMDGRTDLYISDAFHKAFVAVDEKGTEAAAATAVIVAVESAPMIDVSLVVDRPFIFIIQDKPSGTILFMGRVLNPQG